ncbi:MAG: hypothetical protein Kow0068_09930 [Marinilabiliales bacterium]
MEKLIKILPVVILIVILAAACKKKKEEKIIGTWTLVEMTNTSATKTTWSFYDGNLLIINEADSSNNIISSDSAYYEVKQRFFKYFVDISNLSVDEDGSYQIIKLNSSSLILQLSYPNYYRREFYK